MKLTRRNLLHMQAYAIGSAFITACGKALPTPLPPNTSQSQHTFTPLPTHSPTTTAVPTLTALIHETMDYYRGFTAFAHRVTTYQDADYLYIESHGMPDHPMMIGIRNWQQQVPIPQKYTGDNAWRIPLSPTMATTPISAHDALYSGAIAIAVNGIPIFNALTNTGQDAFLIGALDEWGGHCGRADDYHYHVAPLHLEAIVGVGAPIAFALDGYAIYGSVEPDGSPMQPLDVYNGHLGTDGIYHYHGTPTYPYINGGLVGNVSIENDRIEPQPSLRPLRPPQEPLRGASITEFVIEAEQQYRLVYQINNETYTLTYTIGADTTVFTLTLPNGQQQRQEYRHPPSL